MASKNKINKIILTHPRTGRETKVDSTIYYPFKAAILQSLKDGRGKTFTELSDDVAKIVRKKMPDFKGSISWYTISIRLDLETQGIVETFNEKRVSLCRLSD